MKEKIEQINKNVEWFLNLYTVKWILLFSSLLAIGYVIGIGIGLGMTRASIISF